MDVYIFDIEESLVQANGTIDIDFQTFFKKYFVIDIAIKYFKIYFRCEKPLYK